MQHRRVSRVVGTTWLLVGCATAENIEPGLDSGAFASGTGGGGVGAAGGSLGASGGSNVGNAGSAGALGGAGGVTRASGNGGAPNAGGTSGNGGANNTGGATGTSGAGGAKSSGGAGGGVPAVDAGPQCFGNPPTANVDASALDFQAAPVWRCSAAGTTTIDSTAGTVTSTSCALGTLAVTNDVAQTDAAGQHVMVVRLAGLTLIGGHVLQLTGDKPIVILVAGNVLVDTGSKIDASAKGTTAGPGGSVASSCAGQIGGNGRVATANDDDSGGAGGGAFGTAGGPGGEGNSKANATFGGAGAVSTDTALEPLRGGCSGGIGGGSNNASGGAGGGAFEISASGTITIGTGNNAAELVAGGGGGKGQPGNTGCIGDGGDGGGSGGGILLVSPTPAKFGAKGAARAHGGGGGGGTECNGSNAGQDGHPTDDNAANGGNGEGANGGKGGLCSAAACSGAATAGGNSQVGGSGGGGGGGRVKIITGAAGTGTPVCH